MVHRILAIVGAFPQPQIQEQIVEVVMVMLLELMTERVVELPVLRFMEEIVESVAGELVCNF